MSIKIRKVNNSIEFEVDNERDVRAVLRVLENVQAELPSSTATPDEPSLSPATIRKPTASQDKLERAKEFLRWLMAREDADARRPKQIFSALLNSDGPVRDTELLAAIGAQGTSSKQILGGVVQAIGRNLAQRVNLRAEDAWARQSVNEGGTTHSVFTFTPLMRQAMQEVLEEGFS